MLSRQQQGAARYAVCDHATPLLYGAEQPGLEQLQQLLQGSSPALDQHNRRLQPIAELSSAVHEHVVGRTWQLAELRASFIGSRRHPGARPVAVVLGLGGMSKTALLAEALALWEQQFQWLLLFQAKPNALSFETLLREVDLGLRGETGRYHQHVQQHPADAVYRNTSADFNGPQRLQRLTLNLVRALKAEPMLLVLDNFETNLVSALEGAAESGANSGANSGVSVDTNSAAARCQEPAWADCLATLAPLLRHLLSVGLVTEMVSEPGDPNPDLSCHELVRERIGVWMALQAQDRSGWTEKGVRLAYAMHLQAAFRALQHQDMSAALRCKPAAARWCIACRRCTETGQALGDRKSGANQAPSTARVAARCQSSAPP